MNFWRELKGRVADTDPQARAPISGEVIAVNDALSTKPETVNEDAQGSGWFAKIRLSDPAQLEALMDLAAYEKLTEGH